MILSAIKNRNELQDHILDTLILNVFDLASLHAVFQRMGENGFAKD